MTEWLNKYIKETWSDKIKFIGYSIQTLAIVAFFLVLIVWQIMIWVH